MINKSFLKAWLIAARIKTLPAAISPVFVGTALAYRDNYYNKYTFISIIIASILIQIGTNLSNDLSDFLKGTDTDERLGPQRVAQSGLLSTKQLKKGIVIIFSLSIIIGIYLVLIGGYPIVIIGLTSIACGILYTAGPYPLGYNGLGDLFVFIFFGLVAVLGSYYLQTGTVSFESFICGAAIGSLSTAILVVNNLRDSNTDIKTGKKTLAVRLGPRFVRVMFILLALTTYVLSFYLTYFLFILNQNVFLVLTIITFPIFINITFDIYKISGKKFNVLLGNVAGFIMLYSILFTISILA